jgi:CDP-diglyceride synthetase
MFVLLWGILYALPAEAYWVFLWTLISFVKLPIVASLNFYVGASWFLPTYLGMTQEEVSIFYSPSPIPTAEWIERYGSRKIKVRDSLQRKIPHFLYGFVDIAIWSGTMYAAVLSPAAVLAMQCAYRALYTAVLFLCIEYHERGGAWPAWFLSHQWRIRDGNLRFENQVAVTFGTLWGVIVTKLLWIVSLVPLYAASERSLLLQLCFLPVAVGDAFAEIIGSCFGSYEFEVVGVGDVNKKTWEGVLAMFITTLVSCTGAVWFADSRGDLTGESLTSWLIVAALISLLSTVMETYSPRSTDNFTIPLSGYFILRLYAFLSGM